MTTRKYSSRAQQTTLSSPITDIATTMTVGNGANLMGGRTPVVGETYTVVIDPDTALEEIVDVSNYASGNTLTIERGRDGSSGVAHSAGAIVRHMVIGRDLRESNEHIEATTGHGATGAIVGTTNEQTLTNKTLTSPTITGTGAIAGTFTGGLTGNVTGNLTGNVTGNVTGSSGSTTGNAATATALATGRTISLTGDVTGTSASFDGTGNASITAAIGTNTIVDADINASAAIAWTKIAPSSTVSTTELGYLDGVTSAIQTQIDSKLATATASSTYAPLASPALTGVPTAPTAAANTNTTQVATTAYVQTEINDLVASAPGALDTLNELATALGNDAAFSTTVTTALAARLPLAGGTMSGAIAMGTNKVTGLGTPTTSTDAATKGYVDTVTVAPSNLTGPITSVGSATSVAAQTGTGSTFVMNTSPTLVTPVLGVATATSINGTTIPSSKTLVATDSTDYVVPSQTGNSGKYLTTNGTVSSWATVPAPEVTLAGVETLTNKTLTDPKINQAIGTNTSTTYTFVLTDNNKFITSNNGSAQTLSIPTNASVAFPVGARIDVAWITGAGQPTITAVTPGTTTILSTGATSTSPKLRAVNSVASAVKIATDTWLVTGDVA